MTSFPVPLDNLITYVKTLHADGGPLDHLSDAVTLSERLDEQADALIGHFVDQARRSGASWSQIGASMGVSKQAVQKRFTGSIPAEQKMFTQFTQRACNVLCAAATLAHAALAVGQVGTDHIVVALMSEPEGFAGQIIHAAGITDEQLCAALATGPVPDHVHGEIGALTEIAFTGAGMTALEGAVKAALRLNHNYIGTEHLLLGALFADGETAQKLTSLGITVTATESAVASMMETLHPRR
jgi:ATP-dependent Clp protease ATP-binding subunit ClpA